MTLQDDEPVFHVEHKGQAKDVPPSKIAEAIYLRMLGRCYSTIYSVIKKK